MRDWPYCVYRCVCVCVCVTGPTVYTGVCVIMTCRTVCTGVCVIMTGPTVCTGVCVCDYHHDWPHCVSRCVCVQQCDLRPLCVQENVGDDEYLQEQLVELLMCSNKNEEALYWADKFSIPDDQLPGPVLRCR